MKAKAGLCVLTLAWAACELRELIAGGDHTIVVGRVLPEVCGQPLGKGDQAGAWLGPGRERERHRAALSSS